MVSLKDAHSDTGVMGDLLKKNKKGVGTGTATTNLRSFRPLYCSWNIMNVSLCLGRQWREELLPRFRAPLQSPRGAHASNLLTFLISNRDRLQPPSFPWEEAKDLWSSVCQGGWGISRRGGGRKEPACPDCTSSCSPLRRSRPPSDPQHGQGCHLGCVRGAEQQCQSCQTLALQGTKPLKTGPSPHCVRGQRLHPVPGLSTQVRRERLPLCLGRILLSGLSQGI